MMTLGKFAIGAAIAAVFAVPISLPAKAAPGGHFGGFRGEGAATSGPRSDDRGFSGGSAFSRGGARPFVSRGGVRAGPNGGPRGTAVPFRNRGFGGVGFPRGGFRGSIRDWRGGHWYHGYHGGALGWWWTVGPDWYWYDYPLYPYPIYPGYAPYYGYYYDGYYDGRAGDYIPPQDIGPAPETYWYYCDNPQGYYPYVRMCDGQWRQVPTTPEGAPDNAPPQAGNAPPQASDYPPPEGDDTPPQASDYPPER
jgi:hypothetical protein